MVSVPPVDALALKTIAIPIAVIKVPKIDANIKSSVNAFGIKKFSIIVIIPAKLKLETIVFTPKLFPRKMNPITNKNKSIINTKGPVEIDGI